MNRAIELMLKRYQCQTRPEYERALKEILQEIALVGLWRGRFFEHAAFCKRDIDSYGLIG